VQELVTEQWLALDGVVGTAIGVDGIGARGAEGVSGGARRGRRSRASWASRSCPEVTGPFTRAALGAGDRRGRRSPKRRIPRRPFPRPVPIGVSTGHPNVSAGTIGARATDGARVFALSNNHIVAAVNGGREGDVLLQPGIADGGRNPDDAIGTLFDFEPLEFCRMLSCPPNRIDAAIALTTAEDLGNETPEGGYGTPRPWTHDAELGLAVQKYGRTTGHTVGRITGVHATIDVSYRTGTARFEDQIVISGDGFSSGGDSGSLVVTKGVLLGDRRPVGLLFAGSPSTRRSRTRSTWCSSASASASTGAEGRRAWPTT
jgi:hypothetical protein